MCIRDSLLYVVIPVTVVFCSNSSIQVNPRCYKCGVTSYYLKQRNLLTPAQYQECLAELEKRESKNQIRNTIKQKHSLWKEISPIFTQILNCHWESERDTDNRLTTWHIMNLLCCDHGISGLQIDINIVVDILIARCVKNIVKLVQVVKYAILAKQFCRLFARQRLICFIVFEAKHRKSSFFAHACSSLHIGKFNFPRFFFLLKKQIQHICTESFSPPVPFKSINF